MKKLKIMMSALMLAAGISALFGAGGVAAFADETEESVTECALEYREEAVAGTCTTKECTRYTSTICGEINHSFVASFAENDTLSFFRD